MDGALAFSVDSLDVDAAGAAVMGGALRPGAGVEEIVVVRMKPDGSGSEWTASLKGTSSAFSGAAIRLAVARDGSVGVFGAVHSDNMPVTDDALPRAAGAAGSAKPYFCRLSADGSRILYATYLAGNGAGGASAVAADASGDLFLAGSTENAGFPFSSILSGEPPLWGLSGFVARFAVAENRFRYVAPIGSLVQSGVLVAPSGDGRVYAAAAANENGRGEGIFVWELDESGSSVRLTRVVEVRGSVSALKVDAMGNFMVAGRSNTVVPSAGASGLPHPFEPTAFVAKFSAEAERSIYATYAGCTYPGGADAAGETVVLACADGPFGVRAAEPVSAAGLEPRSHLMAWPNVVQPCSRTTIEFRALLMWDTRGTGSGEVQVRSGWVDGPAVASGASGMMYAAPGVYFLVQGMRLLATERVRVAPPLRCSSVGEAQGSVTVTTNPVLSCADRAGGSGTHVVADGPSMGGWLELRVLSPDGPIFTAGQGRLLGYTDEWLGNGMEFFLVRRADDKVLGSDRAYVLPLRQCADGPTAIMATGMRAVRDCEHTNWFTLVWHSGGTHTEVRRETGEVAARMIGPTGLVDVVAERDERFGLFVNQGGQWVEVASVLASPGAPCEQGRRAP